jgi:uncharacterized protein
MQNPHGKKLDELKRFISGFNKVVVGFSGGVDSSLLLKVSVMTLGRDKVWAVTGDSESLIPEEMDFCRDLAGRVGLKKGHFVEMKTSELSVPEYRANPVDRCYHCKTELFGRLTDFASKVGADAVFDGSNADDLDDWRPGRRAAGELGVVSPLAEAGITKDELRLMARDLNLPNWDKPALACLSSRIPYGSEVTAEKLDQIARAERFVRSLGFTQLRVRHHGEIARIEILKEEIPRLLGDGLFSRVADKLKSIGFSYVTVDLNGYRSGSMNEGLETKGEDGR